MRYAWSTFFVVSLLIGWTVMADSASGPATKSTSEPDALIAPPFGLSQVSAGEEMDRRVEWWRQARFGMFIHFGIYAIPGRGEWVMYNESIPHREYAKFADEFKPDPDGPVQWASVAKAAGMKYMVLTARHHDGFSMFDSHVNDFNSAKTTAQQDVVKKFVEAARGQGMRVGLYYSPLDWRYPGYFFPDLYLESAEAMREQYHKEIEQLATDYGKLDLLWYDGGGEEWLGFGGIERGNNGWKPRDKGKPYQGKFSWQDDQCNARLRQLQPGILINDRTSTPGDWRTREGAGSLGGYERAQPWELCVTLAGAWGYTRNAKPRSLQELVVMLTNTASRDGNLLLNVGPAPSGYIPEDQVARLKELGQWLERYGEAIYETRGGPFIPTAQFTSTCRDQTLYLHILPGKDNALPNTLKIPAFNNGPKLDSARLLGTNQELMVDRAASGDVTLSIPGASPESPTVVVKLSYDGSVMGVPPMTLPVP